MLRWLWWRVTALVMSHCHGFYPNSQFCAQLQRYHGMDAVGGERAPTAASDASRGPMMWMRHYRVHSGAHAQSGNDWPHLRDRGNNPFTTGTLSHPTRINMRIHWSQEDEPAPNLWAVVWKYVREVLEMAKAFISDRTGQRALWARFRKSLSERCHRDRAGRMESGCVRVSILPATMEGLLRLLESSHVMLCASTMPHWLIGRIITYEATFKDESWMSGSHPHCVSCCFLNSHWQDRKALSKRDWRKIFLIKWIVPHLMLLYSRWCCKPGKFKLCFASSFALLCNQHKW